MKKKLTYKGVMGEVFALTGAVAIIAAAVYFFFGTESYNSQQHFWSWNYTYEFYTVAVVGNYDDSECGIIAHRIYYLRERIWYENGLYQYFIASVYRNIRENISEYRIADEQSGVGCAVLCISS